jgi:hypothetical protein
VGRPSPSRIRIAYISCVLYYFFLFAFVLRRFAFATFFATFFAKNQLI